MRYTTEKIKGLKYRISDGVVYKYSESDQILFDNTTYAIEKLMTYETYTEESLWDLCKPEFTNDTDKYGIVTHSVKLTVPAFCGNTELIVVNLSYCDNAELSYWMLTALNRWQYERLTHRFHNFPSVKKENGFGKPQTTRY